MSEGNVLRTAYKELEFRTLRSVADSGGDAIRFEAAMMGHADPVPTMSADTAALKLREINAAQNAGIEAPQGGGGTGKRIGAMYARGAMLRHRKTGETITIIKANVRVSSQGHPMHEIVTASGQRGITSQKNLEAID